MARKIQQTNVFKWQTPATIIKKLREMDIGDLEKLHDHLSKRVTTNMNKIAKKGLTHAPAPMALSKKVSKGRISAPGTHKLPESSPGYKEQLVKDVYGYQSFLSGKTHTATGAKAWDRKTSSRLGAEYDKLSEGQKRGYWKVYEAYRAEIDVYNLDSERIQKEHLESWVQGGYTNATGKRKDEFFEEIISPLMDDGDVSDFAAAFFK